MMKPRWLLFFLSLIIFVNGLMNFSRINSAAYTPSDYTNTAWYNGTCSECICFAFISNNQSIYQALNCYNNNTCLLFEYLISKSKVRINTNSVLYYSAVSTYITSGSLTTILSDTLDTTMPTLNSNISTAVTGTYWGCCKPSCGWPYKASFTNPPQTCQTDGVTPIGPNVESICNGNNASMCSNQQPWSFNASLSYGFAGAYIVNQNEWYWCGLCYSLVFLSAPLFGKQMIVQIINTAYVNYDTFILHVPGGGWGGGTNGCPIQFSNYNASIWGSTSAGITTRSDCAYLPSSLQSGCYWRFDWLQNVMNTTVQYTIVQCPSILTNITGCIRY